MDETCWGKSIKNVGINRLLLDGVYIAAYPLHDVGNIINIALLTLNLLTIIQYLVVFSWTTYLGRINLKKSTSRSTYVSPRVSRLWASPKTCFWRVFNFYMVFGATAGLRGVSPRSHFSEIVPSPSIYARFVGLSQYKTVFALYPHLNIYLLQGSVDKHASKTANMRQLLYREWARWGRWYKFQPLDAIRWE